MQANAPRRCSQIAVRPPQVEPLEERLAPAATYYHQLIGRLGLSGVSSFGYSGPVGLTPTQIRHAYGFDAINFDGVVGDGSGQTIAIVDAFDDPRFVSSGAPNFVNSDLHKFDVAFGLPDPPSFVKLDQTGGTNYPQSNGGWATEIALDVEWAHALAPMANIVLVEANWSTYADLFAAVNLAKSLPGVSDISMSFGGTEFAAQLQMDSTFVTPPGHQGVTFVAASGDSGASAVYPASSPLVVAVGGTTLSVDAAGNYFGESAWKYSGGGLGRYESHPDFQSGVLYSSAQRGTPDVAFDADPNSGVPIYDSFNNSPDAPWEEVGGTSMAAPAWSALIAIANQGRVLAGQGTLDGPSQTLPKLYALPNADFHDITTGSNGNAARPGYDLVTGRGSPIANLVARDLIDGAAIATGPRIISCTPTGAVVRPVNSIRVTFDQSIVPPSLTTADVTVTAPGGIRLPITRVAAVAGSNYTQFNIYFYSRTTPGVYQIVIGPDIRNLAGQQMDQNANGTPGEASDVYTATFGLVGVTRYTATDLPLTILDNQATSSSINVPSDVLITDVTVRVNLKHKKDSDLIIQLVSPSGTVVTLSHQRGGVGRNYYYTVFNDFTMMPIGRGFAPFFGSYRPDESLSVFAGLNGRGTWQLRVTDLAAGNEGTLLSWSLSLRGVPGDGSGGPA